MGGATGGEQRVSWAGWSDFFAMGGYALYVWGSYAVTAGLIVLEIGSLVTRRAGILRRQARGNNLSS